MYSTWREDSEIPEFMEFKAHGGLPAELLPDPDYLRLHASACKVAYTSGASGYFDALQDFFDQNGDGTFDIFSDALSMRLKDIAPRRWDSEGAVEYDADDTSSYSRRILRSAG